MFSKSACVREQEDGFERTPPTLFKIAEEGIEVVAGSELDGERGIVIGKDSQRNIFKKSEKSGDISKRTN